MTRPTPTPPQQPRPTAEARSEAADIRQGDLITALMAASSGRPDAKPARLEEYLRDRAGILASHGHGLYQFAHRSFQEYLAACHLARCDFPDTLSGLVKTDPNRLRVRDWQAALVRGSVLPARRAGPAQRSRTTAIAPSLIAAQSRV